MEFLEQLRDTINNLEVPPSTNILRHFLEELFSFWGSLCISIIVKFRIIPKSSKK